MDPQTDELPELAAPAAAARWPAVYREPRGMLRARVAAAVVRHAVRELPLRLRLPDGRAFGAGGAADPEMTVHRPESFFRRVGSAGLIGFGESYQAGDWDADDLAGLLGVFARNVRTLVPASLQRLRRLHVVRRPRTENETFDNARDNIAAHYDLSDDMFALFLDPTMTYSSALFAKDELESEDTGVTVLEEAQHRKIDRLLDLTGANVHTITLSENQLSYTRQRAELAGVGGNVHAELRDYRDTEGRYDAVLSVEMIEAVGREHWPVYFGALSRLVAPGGRVGLQAITMPDDRMRATSRTQTWITKYIFPGGMIPSTAAIRDNAHRAGLHVLDDLSFGTHYAHTLKVWGERLVANASRLGALGFDETFRRTWRLYLAYSEAGFASGYLDVHQLVLGRGSVVSVV